MNVDMHEMPFKDMPGIKYKFHEFPPLRFLEVIGRFDDRDSEEQYIYIETRTRYEKILEYSDENEFEKWKEDVEKIVALLKRKEQICVIVKNKGDRLSEEEKKTYEAIFHSLRCYDTEFEDKLKSELKAALLSNGGSTLISNKETIISETETVAQNTHEKELLEKDLRKRKAILQELERCIDYGDYEEPGQETVYRLANGWHRLGKCTDEALSQEFTKLHKKYWVIVDQIYKTSRRKINLEKAINDKQTKQEWMEGHIAFLDRKMSSSPKRDYYIFSMKNYYINQAYELKRDLESLRKQYDREVR